jgi:hypothetical protein
MFGGNSNTVTLVYAPIDAPEMQYSVHGESVDEVVRRLFDAYGLHGDLVVEPLSDGETVFRNVTQVFAAEMNNTFDDIEATWEESGRVVIRGI